MKLKIYNQEMKQARGNGVYNHLGFNR